MVFKQRKNENMALFLLRCITRILSIAVLILLALFAFGYNGVTNGVNRNEFIGLLFFPLGVGLGFIFGWKNELIGGLVSATSLACFYFVYGLFTGHLPGGVWFAVFTIPGFLFLAYGLLRLRWFHRHNPSRTI